MCKSKIIKKIFFIPLAALIIIIFIAGCKTEGITLTERNHGDNLTLKINDTLEIRLESNPTTGYSWFLGEQIDNNIISITDPEFIQAKKDKKLVGAGGYEVFTVKAISKGETSIILNYERPWEEEEEPIKTFEITILVD